jgi:DNA-binding transcriptional regulator PaaX
MMEEVVDRGWLVLLVRVPAEPARHRMALWRELRRFGAVPLGQAVWAVPDLPAAHRLLERLAELAEVAEGTLLVLVAHGYAARDAGRLEQLYAEAREQEWAEFHADCGKYLAELEKEEKSGKYTLAELEEEEQSLDRLRRWYRELRSRDLLGGPASVDAATDLKTCEVQFDVYAEHVYAALGSPNS